MQGELTQEMTRAERRAAEERSRSSRSRRRQRGAEASRPTAAPAAAATAAPAATGAVALLERPVVEALEPAPTETRSSRTGRREAHRARRGHRRRTAGAIAVVAVLGLGGTAAVAWAGLLPEQVEQLVLQVAGSPAEAAPQAAEPVPSVDATPSATLTESADERLLSTVDLCRSLSRGELDPASASYRTLVNAAGAADLDAWCADLTGDAARADS